jgi:hypothetical protein
MTIRKLTTLIIAAFAALFSSNPSSADQLASIEDLKQAAGRTISIPVPRDLRNRDVVLVRFPGTRTGILFKCDRLEARVHCDVEPEPRDPDKIPQWSAITSSAATAVNMLDLHFGRVRPHALVWIGREVLLIACDYTYEGQQKPHCNTKLLDQYADTLK